MNTPCIYDFPFCIEITDLTTESTTREYVKSKDEVLNQINSNNDDLYFVVGWDRQAQEVVGMSHPNIDTEHQMSV